MIATILTIKVKDGDFMEWLDLDLPSPLSTKEVNQYSADYWNNKNEATPYEITYAIEGFFETSKNRKYLHDVAARIAYALKGSYEVTTTDTNCDTVSLSRFSHIERVPSHNSQVEANAFNGSRNEIFDALRYKAYQMYRSNTLNLEALTTYGNHISNGSEHVKYLAPNVFKWVESKYEGRQSTMSRAEAGRAASKLRSDKVKDKIFSALKYPLFFNMEKQTITQASNRLSVSRSTFTKYLKIYHQLQKVSRELRSSPTPYVRLVLSPFLEMAKVVSSIVKWTPQMAGSVIVAPVMSTAPPDTQSN